MKALVAAPASRCERTAVAEPIRFALERAMSASTMHPHACAPARCLCVQIPVRIRRFRHLPVRVCASACEPRLSRAAPVLRAGRFGWMVRVARRGQYGKRI